MSVLSVENVPIRSSLGDGIQSGIYHLLRRYTHCGTDMVKAVRQPVGSLNFNASHLALQHKGKIIPRRGRHANEQETT